MNKCDRCGREHEPGALWECATCSAVLCGDQVQATMARDQHGAMITRATHPVSSVERRLCGPVRKRLRQFGFDAVPDMQQPFE